LRAIHPPEAVDADYLGKQAARANDISFPFVEFLWQRASWPAVVRTLPRIRRDLRNFGTCLAKIDHYFESADRLGFGARAFVATELEYLFTLSRSMFDLIQEVIRAIWDQTQFLNDPVRQKAKRRMPKSFADVALKGDTEVPAPNIQQKFQVPRELADAYASIAPFFAQVRRFRDSVVHRGNSVDVVFVTERGFCVDPAAAPFCHFQVWGRKELWFNDKIASLRPFLAHVVVQTLDGCCALLDAMAAGIGFPEQLAPEYGVHQRFGHNDSIINAKMIFEGRASGWWREEAG